MNEPINSDPSGKFENAKLSNSEAMQMYLTKHQKAVMALDQNPNEEIERVIKDAEIIFLNEDGKHPDVEQRCADALLALDRVGKEEKIN